MQPSNFKVDVTAVGKEEFEKVFSIFFNRPYKENPKSRGTIVKYCSKAKETGLAFFEYERTDPAKIYNIRDGKDVSVSLGPVEKLPFEMDVKQATIIAWNWLKQCPKEFWGDEPDIDGSVYREAWRIYNTYSYFGPLVVVQPVWAEYHK